MIQVSAAFFLTTAAPMVMLWRYNRATTLRSAILWSYVAWFSILLLAAASVWGNAKQMALSHYLALSLMGCSAVSVLGARRPGAEAWNFVVLGLFAVFLLPIAEGRGALRLTPAYLGFLGVVLGFGALNYLPTRMAPGTVLLSGASTLLFLSLVNKKMEIQGIAILLLAFGIHGCWASFLIPRKGRSPADRLWLQFRDRFGVVWGQRAQEQFNRAAQNQNLQFRLQWHGIVPLSSNESDPMNKAIPLLQSVLRRFSSETPDPAQEEAPV